MVVLICALSLSLEVVSGKSVRAISTWLLQLWRHFFLIRQIGGDWAEHGGCCCWWWCWVLMFSWPPPHASPLPCSSQCSASGFPSVFPKLHWFWPLYLRGPGPLALAVTLCWQKNTESWQRCSQKTQSMRSLSAVLLFLGYCFVTVSGGKTLLGVCFLLFQGFRFLFMFI